MTIRGAALVLSALALCACTTGPADGHKAPSAGQTAPPPAAGPAPAALGDTSPGTLEAKTAMAGAGIGALSGNDAGYYMDQQEKKLRQQLQNSGVSIRRVGDNLVLVLPGNLVFASDASEIAPAFDSTLNGLVGILKEYDKTVVAVTGHTDGQGSDQYNQGLSERRAGAVAKYLIGQGVIPQRLVVSGMGKTQPVASNNTPEGRLANRRVEIKLSPLTTS